MKWIKKGKFIEPDNSKDWMQSHTMTPTVLHVEGNKYRVFFCGRNSLNQSHIGYANIEVNPEKKELNFS